MTIERTSFPSPVSVVTVNTAKSHQRVEHTDDDLLIEGYIDAAYHLVEKFTGVFLQETQVSRTSNWMSSESSVMNRNNATTRDSTISGRVCLANQESEAMSACHRLVISISVARRSDISRRSNSILSS